MQESESIDYSKLRNYYSKIDLSLWEDDINFCFDLCRQATTEKEKKQGSLKFYGVFLQLIEVFWINVFAFSSNDLSMLFLDNAKLRERISVHYMSEIFIEYLLENWVFGIKEKTVSSDFQTKKSFYKIFLHEATEDYFADYQLLNAYKHGFRVQSQGYANVMISSDANPEQRFLIGEYSGSIEYFTREKKDGKEMIFGNTILFYWERVFKKSLFLINILENAKKILLHNGTRNIQLTTLVALNETVIGKHFGNVRMKNEQSF